MLGSLGVVDFGQLLGLSEPAKRASNKTDVGKRPIAKKSTRVAARSTQKTTNNKASEKAPAPKRKRIVGDPSEAALSKARRRTMNRRAKPVTSTQEPTLLPKNLQSLLLKESSPSLPRRLPVLWNRPRKKLPLPGETFFPGKGICHIPILSTWALTRALSGQKGRFLSIERRAFPRIG
jgi:hypothetical protein